MSDITTLVERLRDATMLEPRITLYDEAAARIAELEGEVNRLATTLSDWHDVPPEYEGEPLNFHRGWETAIRAIFAILARPAP